MRKEAAEAGHVLGNQSGANLGCCELDMARKSSSRKPTVLSFTDWELTGAAADSGG